MTILFRTAARRVPLPSFAAVDFTAAEQSQKYFGVADVIRIDREEIAIEEDQVAEFSDSQRARIFTAPGSGGGIQGVAADAIVETDPLFRDKGRMIMFFATFA